ncbi:hypothetical protein [Spirulina sp. 06S082]|uniref:hypothetical protein n=1 Tax=Spirulina sp. 06S082 TaxID=3110248 RepID=UPI002B1EDFC7|nr:hypothetical protein [Spirulina sp. 06S082]
MKLFLIICLSFSSFLYPQFVLGQTLTPELIKETEIETKETEPLDEGDSAESGSMVGDFFTQTLETCELDSSYLNPSVQEELIQQQGVITETTISQTSLTIPSLWWIRDQFKNKKLVQNWLAFPEKRRIDLFVNRQLWSQMDYLDRYSFVNHFGTTARDYGYELRVFDRQPKCLAIYNCSLQDTTYECKVDLEPSRRDAFNIF